MALLARLKRRGALGDVHPADLDRLREFVETRGGVQAYVEPKTAVTATTVVLIAADGEWTRRRIGSPEAARAFGRKHDIPVYDAMVTGYPQRMRDWTARNKPSGR